MDTLWLTDAEKANIKMNVRKWRVKPGPPVITIFVSHSANCKYRGDEFCKRCDCPKHLRWSHYGKQNRVSAQTRSWAEAENKKRDIEDQLSGPRQFSGRQSGDALPDNFENLLSGSGDEMQSARALFAER